MIKFFVILVTVLIYNHFKTHTLKEIWLNTGSKVLCLNQITKDTLKIFFPIFHMLQDPY